MHRPDIWEESKYEHCVKPGAKLWLLASASSRDPAAFSVSRLEEAALGHPVVVIHVAGDTIGICLMTSNGQPEHGKIEITEQSTYREKHRGSLNEPLRLISKARYPMECSYLDTRNAYLVTLKMLEPLAREPPMLDSRSYEVLQEQTATLIEAFDMKAYREALRKDPEIHNRFKSLEEHITATDLRGPPPRRGSLVAYGIDHSVQTLDSLHQPRPSGVFVVVSTKGSDFSGAVWAYLVILVPRAPLATLKGADQHYWSHFFLPICPHSDELMPCKCIRGKPLSLLSDNTLDKAYLQTAFRQQQQQQQQQQQHATTIEPVRDSSKCLCIRLTYRVALDLRLVSEVHGDKRLDDKSLALLEVAEQLRDRMENCTADSLACMTGATAQDEPEKKGSEREEEEADYSTIGTGAAANRTQEFQPAERAKRQATGRAQPPFREDSKAKSHSANPPADEEEAQPIKKWGLDTPSDWFSPGGSLHPSAS